MIRFKKMHPIVILVFFAFTFIITACMNNPFYSTVSFIFAYLSLISTSGFRKLRSLPLSLVIIFFVGLFNAIFVHYGDTILFSKGYTNYTFEAFFYGINQGFVIVAFFIWFLLFSEIFDSNKVLFVFKFAPKLALIFSMILSFIPRFINKYEDIKIAKLGLNGGNAPKGLKNRLNSSLDGFSSLVTYSLESSIITANSMDSRGYDIKNMSFKRYKWNSRDLIMLSLFLIEFVVVMVYKFKGLTIFVFQPKISFENSSYFALFVSCLFMITPCIVNILEDVSWKISKSKI